MKKGPAEGPFLYCKAKIQHFGAKCKSASADDYSVKSAKRRIIFCGGDCGKNTETTLMAQGLLMSRLTYSVRSAVWNTRRPNWGMTAMRCSIHWEEISS